MRMEARERQVRIYVAPDGRTPFLRWLTTLRDQRAKQKIEARIGRVRLGNFGQARGVGEGVLELKVDYGPGYRVYFGQDGADLVILLCGGDKSTQNADIRQAKTYWAQYQKEKGDAHR
jgi:putative addiction module killer protein